MVRDPNLSSLARRGLDMPEPGFVDVRPVVADGYPIVDNMFKVAASQRSPATA